MMTVTSWIDGASARHSIYGIRVVLGAKLPKFNLLLVIYKCSTSRDLIFGMERICRGHSATHTSIAR